MYHGHFQAQTWYNDFLTRLRKLPEYRTENDFKPCWIKTMYLELDALLKSKRVYRDEHQKTTTSSAFEAEFKSSSYLPQNIINSVDLELIKGIVYCDKNEFLYYCDKAGNYTFLGDISEISSEKSTAVIKCSTLLNTRITSELGSEFNFWKTLWKDAGMATEMFFLARRSIEDAISNNIPPSQLKIKLKGVEHNYKDIFHYVNDEWNEDTFIEDLHSFCVKTLINEILPSSIISKGLATVCYETKDGLFKRYAIRPSFREQFTFETYLKKLFNGAEITMKIPHIKEQPRVISDTDEFASKYKLIQGWADVLNKEIKQYDKIDDCKILKTFLTPYDNDEKKFIMAWAYSVLHPSTSEGIGLMIKTGGGAFKTFGYSNMISLLLSKMYGGDKEELTHKVIRDNWVKNDQLLETTTGGLSKCALLLNDECSSNSIDKYKDLSGSTSKVGISYTYKKVFEVPKSITIYNRWLFLTNQNIIINDTDGVFERRLAIIDRMDIKNLPKPYSQSEYHKHVEKELLQFYNLANSCYKELKEQFGDLTTAANNMSFSKNLKQAYAEDKKLWIIRELTAGLEDDEECAKYSIPEYKAIISKLCEEYEVNVKGMKNFLEETDACIKKNRIGTTLANGTERYNGHKIYRLKPEVLKKLETLDETEVDNNINDLI